MANDTHSLHAYLRHFLDDLVSLLRTARANSPTGAAPEEIGMRFCPRIRSLHRQRIYCADPARDQRVLEPVLQRGRRAVNFRLIAEQWDRTGLARGETPGKWAENRLCRRATPASACRRTLEFLHRPPTLAGTSANADPHHFGEAGAGVLKLLIAFSMLCATSCSAPTSPPPRSRRAGARFLCASAALVTLGLAPVSAHNPSAFAPDAEPGAYTPSPANVPAARFNPSLAGVLHYFHYPTRQATRTTLSPLPPMRSPTNREASFPSVPKPPATSEQDARTALLPDSVSQALDDSNHHQAVLDTQLPQDRPNDNTATATSQSGDVTLPAGARQQIVPFLEGTDVFWTWQRRDEAPDLNLKWPYYLEANIFCSSNCTSEFHKRCAGIATRDTPRWMVYLWDPRRSHPHAPRTIQSCTYAIVYAARQRSVLPSLEQPRRYQARGHPRRARRAYP